MVRLGFRNSRYLRLRPTWAAGLGSAPSSWRWLGGTPLTPKGRRTWGERATARPEATSEPTDWA
eukprot:9144119-Alexandrium_andersonii.AAC.1